MTGSGAPQVAAERGGAGPGGPDLVRAGRHAAVSLAGSVVAGVSGLALTVVVGQGLGATASGVFFVVVAVVTVAATVGRAGADTGLVWALARARATGRAADTGRIVTVALVPPVVLSVGLALACLAGAPFLADLTGVGDAALVAAAAPFIALAGPLMVLTAALRGTGGITAYTSVHNLLVPGLRPLLVGGAIAAGTGLSGALLAWNAPFVIGVAVAALLVARRTAAVRAGSAAVPPRPVAELSGTFWRFSTPRAVASVLEVVLVWGDVVLVAALASPAEAGVYAAASRFITTGTLAEGALRIAIAPQVSRLLALGDRQGAALLCATATQWVVLLSWPLYLGLALYGPVVLGLFGPEFVSGAAALAVLAAAMSVVLAGGNNQTVLLMSGLSGWQMANKAAALTTNLALNLLLIPLWGIEGAAVAWAAAMLLDAALALVQVRRGVGVRMPLSGVARIGALSVLVFVPIGLVVRSAGGPEPVTCAAAMLVSALVLAGLVVLDRDNLDLARVLPAARRHT